jgi:hypothetical protein
LPFDAVVEIDAFLCVMAQRYPSYFGSGWDDIWAT